MEIRICKTPAELGKSAAKYVAEELRRIIAEKGCARIALSTGASQFDTISSLIQEDVDWRCVEMFHLDEYVNLPKSHKASFRKYLKERFTSHVNLKKAHFVDGTPEGIATLSEEILRAPIDIGLIGIGENAHIAFNDPPADFEVEDPYIIVNLNDTCKNQQVGEGWFACADDIPKQAVSMSVKQILRCKKIVSCVPYAVKSKAVKETLTNEKTNLIPATILKEHPSFILYVDQDSAAAILADGVAL